MTANRAAWTLVLFVSAFFALVPCSAGQVPKGKRILLPSAPTVETPASAIVDDQGLSSIVYGLSEYGEDPGLGAWIAETVPAVIQPSTWSQAGGAGVITYYAPAKMMVVRQTPAVHSQIDGFLKNVKKTLPQGKTTPMTAKATGAMNDRGIMPAQFTTLAAGRAVDAGAAAKSGYPIPAPLQQPKHLFHFMIRYEGDGAVDASVATLAKALVGDSAVVEEKAEPGKAEPSKSPSLGQLFHVILRYEGDGIIDANVAEVIKAIQADKGSALIPMVTPSCSGSGTTDPKLAPNLPGWTAPPTGPPLPSIPASPPAQNTQPTPNTNSQPGTTVAPAARYLSGASSYSSPPTVNAPVGLVMPPADAAPVKIAPAVRN